jgi:uncharacterized protein
MTAYAQEYSAPVVPPVVPPLQLPAIGYTIAANDNPTGKPASHAHRNGDWIQTFLGGMFFPMDPRADEIDIEDIAHSLSMQCRFCGHCTDFYSVAEHSVLIAHWLLTYGAPNHIALWGLLHDATEAYLTDVPRPVKPFLVEYRPAELRLQRAVAERFCLPREIPQEVHDADRRILTDEMQQIMAPPPAVWATHAEPLGVTIECWEPTRAKSEFLCVYEFLVEHRKGVSV